MWDVEFDGNTNEIASVPKRILDGFEENEAFESTGQERPTARFEAMYKVEMPGRYPYDTYVLQSKTDGEREKEDVLCFLAANKDQIIGYGEMSYRDFEDDSENKSLFPSLTHLKINKADKSFSNGDYELKMLVLMNEVSLRLFEKELTADRENEVSKDVWKSLLEIGAVEKVTGKAYKYKFKARALD